MSEKDIIRKALKRQFQTKQDRTEARPGQIGNGYGTVAVSGREHYVYCRVAGMVEEVFNNRVPSENDLLVTVGFDPAQPNLYQVLSTRTATPGGTTGGAVTGYAPAIRYQYMAAGGGQDPLWVQKRQFLPLRIGPYSGMLIQVYRDIVWTGTAFAAVNTQTVDLTAHIPATAGKAALVLITINTSGAVVATKGSEVDIADLGADDVPTVPAASREVLGAVRVYNGQTAVQEARTNTDIVDLRFSGWSAESVLAHGAVTVSDTSTIDLTLTGQALSADVIPGGIDAADLASGAAADGYVLTADGAGGAAWEEGGGGGHVIQEEGTSLTQRANLNFIGSFVTATDDAGNDATKITIADLTISGNVSPAVCQGRLTLESGVPVSTTDQTAKATLYFTPYKGNMIGLYDGSSTWTVYSITERSLALTGLTADTNYDIFAYDNSGTVTLEALAWTNATTRATALTTQDGIYVKTGATTRRYLGTIRITGTTGQCEDSLVKRFVWNYYNRDKKILTYANGTSHTYSGAERNWNNATGPFWSFVNGVPSVLDLGFKANSRLNSGDYIQIRCMVDGVAHSDMGRSNGVNTIYPQDFVNIEKVYLEGFHTGVIMEATVGSILFYSIYVNGDLLG